MTFTDQLDGVAELTSIEYGCFKIQFNPPLSEEMHIRHIFGKMDKLVMLGNYGTPVQHISIFKEACDYLNARELPYKLRFVWTMENSVTFNIKCLCGLLFNIRWLRRYA